MPLQWKKRRRKLYLYKSVRRNGRRKWICWGTGEEAQRLMEVEKRRMANEAQVAAEVRRVLQEARNDEFTIVSVIHQHKALLAQVLQRSGYYRHCGGPWMKKHMKKIAKYSTEIMPASERRKVIQKAQQGDAAALPALRELLDRCGESVVTALGNLARQAEEKILKVRYPNDLMQQEVVRRYMSQLRAQLAPAGTPVLEQLLAESVALCWLDKYLLETWAAHATLSPQDRAYLDKRRSAAHRSFLSALRTFATVRKPTAPALQVNQLMLRT
jgi:hypothetical protein